MAMEHADILIVGGGIAGLSTACHLADQVPGGVSIALLEREQLPGFYASGHNAGVARQLTGRAEHTALAIEGRKRLQSAGLMDTRGGYLLAAGAGGVDALTLEAQNFQLPVERLPGSPMPGFLSREYLSIPSDGIIDIDGMLQHCALGARAGGAVLKFGTQVQAIAPDARGFHVETDHGTWQARILVNAAGAWARDVGRMAGGLDVPFEPLRRHLIWSNAPYPGHLPWAWWADRPIYVRPESGGILLCACEEQNVPLPSRGRQPDNDPTILDSLSASLGEVAPDLADCPIARIWSGFRTFAPDRRFVVGYDPVNPRLFWVAGLGGHGMTTGLAVGDLAAKAILRREDPGCLAPTVRWPVAIS